MSRILLDKRFLIDVDAFNYTLKRDLVVSKTEDGKEIENYKDPKYMRDLPAALREYVQQCSKLKLKPEQSILDCELNQTFLRIEEKIDEIAEWIKTQDREKWTKPQK